MGNSLTRKIVVISAINFTEGGPLTVLRDCLASAAKQLPEDWKIIALVHNQILLDEARVNFKEFPNAKRSWLIRLYYEWFFFYFLSKRLKPDLWLSLHDITPNVCANKRAVYCHNPSPFFSYPFKDILLSPKLWMFNKFYKYLYAINIRKNDFVIVQQSWIRDKFAELYGCLNIVVAHPNIPLTKVLPHSVEDVKKNIFLYPAFPRVFKNFEVICMAVEELKLRSINDFEVIFTIDGNENKYSKKLKKQYGHLPNISFIGLQDKRSMDALYSQAKAVIFPSKLETWGLPITEAKAYAKHLIISDLPYAKETVGDYDKVSFFHPDNEEKLSQLMIDVIDDNINHTGNTKETVKAPFAASWNSLWAQLISVQKVETKVSTLNKNTFWSFIGGVIPAFVAIVSIPYILSVIGLQLFAITSLILSITIFFFVYDLGMSKTMTFLISKSASDKFSTDVDLIGSSLTSTLILSVLITLILYSLAPYFVEHWMNLDKGIRKEALLAFKISVLSIIPGLVSNTLKGILEGRSKFKEANICKVFSGSGIFLAPIIVIAFISQRLVDISIAIVVFRWLALILYVIYTIPFSQFLLLRVKRQSLNFIWRYGVWAAISGFISTTFVYGDRFVVAGYLSSHDLAVYIASQDILIRYLLIPWSMAIVLLPIFSSDSRGKSEVIDLYRNQQRRIYQVSFGLLLLALIIGLFLVRVVDVSSLPESFPYVVMIQIIGIFFCARSQLPLVYLFGRGVPRLIAKIFLGELMIYILLAPLMFSSFSVIGACIVWTGRLVIEYYLLSFYTERLMKK